MLFASLNRLTLTDHDLFNCFGAESSSLHAVQTKVVSKSVPIELFESQEGLFDLT